MAADLNQVEEKRALDRSYADPANWRGPFYYNKADKRIFPPRRLPGTGWTTNFANKWSVTALALIVVASLSIAALAFAISGL